MTVPAAMLAPASRSVKRPSALHSRNVSRHTLRWDDTCAPAACVRGSGAAEGALAPG